MNRRYQNREGEVSGISIVLGIVLCITIASALLVIVRSTSMAGVSKRSHLQEPSLQRTSSQPVGSGTRTSPGMPTSSTPSVGTDFIALPRARTEFRSRDQRYIFVITSEDGWATKQPSGELFVLTKDGGRLSLWKKRLPQEYGPRYVLIGDQGQVLMLDEWINVKSRYAVVVLDHRAAVNVERSFEEVRNAVGVSEAKLVELANGGSWWISGEPRLEQSGKVARISVGGRILRVDLTSGDLMR